MPKDIDKGIERNAMVKQAPKVEDITWGDVYLEDATDEQCGLAVVRTLKTIHRTLGGMAIHVDDPDETVAACWDAIWRVEEGLSRVRDQLRSLRQREELEQLKVELHDETVRCDEWEKMYNQATTSVEVERLRMEANNEDGLKTPMPSNTGGITCGEFVTGCS